MKYFSILCLLLLGIIWVSDVEAGRRKSKCGKDMVEVYSPDAGGTSCEPRVAKPTPPPVSLANIAEIYPTSGKEGDMMTIYGSNFDKVQSVIFNNNISAPFKVQTYSWGQRSEIRITIPIGAQTGPIQVINPAGGAKVQVTILETAKPPVISSFTPQEGGAEDSVTIQGNQFKTVRQVLFNCQQSWAGRVFCEEGKFEIISPTQLRVTVPTGVSGNKAIVVINTAGEATTAQEFRIRNTPSIREIHPAEGYPGDTVSIIGTNLNNLKTITFNGKALSAKSTDAWQIKVAIPEESSDGTMTVTTIDGTAQSPTIFRVKKRPPPPKQEPVAIQEGPKKKTINPNTGKEEYCFGAVGKMCLGVDDSIKDSTKSSVPSIFTQLGCEAEVNGTRDCWVFPGSIGHDLCCMKNKYGQMCGGIMADGQPAGWFNNDGHCAQEWADCGWDIVHGRGWKWRFSTQPADLSGPISSERTRNLYGYDEVVETAPICAPDGANITFRKDTDFQFCCSKQGQAYWAIVPVAVPGGGFVPVKEDWITCGPPPAKKWFGILSVGKTDGTKPIKADTPPPPPKGYPIVKTKAPVPADVPAVSQPSEKKIQSADVPSPYALPPPPSPYTLPPPPSPSAKTEEPANKKLPPQEETTTPKCEHGTWSPTFKRCIEDQAPEEAAPPDCGAGAHWSPTLQSCQSD